MKTAVEFDYGRRSMILGSPSDFIDIQLEREEYHEIIRALVGALSSTRDQEKFGIHTDLINKACRRIGDPEFSEEEG